MRSITTALVVCWFMCAAAPAGEAAAPRVTLAEPTFRIVNDKPLLESKVVTTGGTLLDADLLKLSVTSWRDDKGTNLGNKDAKAFYGDVMAMTMGTGAETRLRLTGKHKPAEGAKTMSIAGSMPFKVGSGLQEGVTKNVSFRVGTTVKVGPYTFKVVAIEPTKDLLGGDLVEGQLISFTFNSPVQLKGFDAFKELTFLDAAGKKHPSAEKSFTSSFNKGGEHKISIALLPPKGPLDVRWGVYTKITVVTVPLKHNGPIAKTP